jgi:hypothetical protein
MQVLQAITMHLSVSLTNSIWSIEAAEDNWVISFFEEKNSWILRVECTSEYSEFLMLNCR